MSLSSFLFFSKRFAPSDLPATIVYLFVILYPRAAVLSSAIAALQYNDELFAAGSTITVMYFILPVSLLFVLDKNTQQQQYIRLFVHRNAAGHPCPAGPLCRARESGNAGSPLRRQAANF
jgi:hypothetical protein